jgi:putative transposase
VVTPAARREATTYLRQTFEMSERRACRGIGTDRTGVRYQGVRPDEGALRERLKALAQERRRFGYRRLHVLFGARATPSTGSGCSGSTARSG